MPLIPNVTIPELVRSNRSNRLSKKTLLWDFENGEVATTPDGNIIVHGGHSKLSTCSCLENFVRKVLATPRGEAAIYPFSYGSDLHRLVGQSPEYCESRLSTMVAETLAVLKSFSRVNIDRLETTKDHLDFDLTLFRHDDSTISPRNITVGEI